MARILVTGGRGNLGRDVVRQFQTTDHTVRIMSRKETPAETPTGVEWVQANLVTGDGLGEALQGVDVLIHSASNPLRNTYETDVLGTRKLLEHARVQGLKHFIYISIVGIDRILHPYYHYKLATELEIVESHVPYSILRISQFHSFVDGYVFNPLRNIEDATFCIPTDVKFQTVDTRDVANYLAKIVEAEPAGRLPDIAGPQVMRLGEMLDGWMQAQNIKRTVEDSNGAQGHLQMPETLITGFTHAYNTAPDNSIGSITWAQFLQEKYS